VRYATEISKVRKHGNSVPKRILSLIDNELIAYGRQRDFLVLVDQSAREEFREFMNDIAIKRAEVQFKLDQVEGIFAQTRALDSAGDAAKARRIESSVAEPMKELNSEADSLVSIINKGTGIVAKLATS
jgi:DNA-binding Lrp family transcriptional regulator